MTKLIKCPICNEPLTRVRSNFQQTFVWNDDKQLYEEKEGRDYTSFTCGQCGDEIGGGYFEQIDDQRWGIIPNVSNAFL